MASESLIRDSGDANWYLGIAEDFSVAFPIDEIVEGLCEKQAIGKPVREAKQDARRAVLEAYNTASSALQIQKARQAERRNQPRELSALADKLGEMIKIYDDVVSSLGTKEGRATRKHIEEIFAASYDAKKLRVVLNTFDGQWKDFSKVGNVLTNAHRWLTIGGKLIQPKRGRPREFAFYFVNHISTSWVKLTGSLPTRSYDAYSGKETGDFHAYCAAAAVTVAGLHRIASIDAAVQQVCSQWRDKGMPAEIW